MSDRHNVQCCRFAEPTLFVAHPYWTEAEACPWSCQADGYPRPVEDTGICRVCGRWQPRPAQPPQPIADDGR